MEILFLIQLWVISILIALFCKKIELYYESADNLEELASVLIMERIRIRKLPQDSQLEAMKTWKSKLDIFEERQNSQAANNSSYEIRRVK